MLGFAVLTMILAVLERKEKKEHNEGRKEKRKRSGEKEKETKMRFVIKERFFMSEV